MSASELRKLSREELTRYMVNLKTAYRTGAMERDMFDRARAMVRTEVLRRMRLNIE